MPRRGAGGDGRFKDTIRRGGASLVGSFTQQASATAAFVRAVEPDAKDHSLLVITDLPPALLRKRVLDKEPWASVVRARHDNATEWLATTSFDGQHPTAVDVHYAHHGAILNATQELADALTAIAEGFVPKQGAALLTLARMLMDVMLATLASVFHGHGASSFTADIKAARGLHHITQGRPLHDIICGAV